MGSLLLLRARGIAASPIQNLPTSLIDKLGLLHSLKFLLPLRILFINPTLFTLQEGLLVLHELSRRGLSSPRVSPLLLAIGPIVDLRREGALPHLILPSLLIDMVLVFLQILIPRPLLVDQAVGHVILRSDS